MIGYDAIFSRSQSGHTLFGAFETARAVSVINGENLSRTLEKLSFPFSD